MEPGHQSRIAVAVAAVMTLAAPAWGRERAQDPPPDEAPAVLEPDTGVGPAPAEAPPEDPRRTAGGALRFFMASRNYRSLRDLRSAMTAGLQGRFDHDSTPFCGKRGIRIATFEFREADLKPVPARPSKTAALQPAPAAGHPGYTASVRSLWAEQGETIELRTETVRLNRGEDGLWRVSDLRAEAAEKLRFAEAIDGVTTLRMLLRAWHKGDPEAARPHLSTVFEAGHADGPESVQALFGQDAEGRRHAAYQILEVRPAPGGVIAKVRLYFAPEDQPFPISGEAHALRLVRKGPRFLLDSWN